MEERAPDAGCHCNRCRNWRDYWQRYGAPQSPAPEPQAVQQANWRPVDTAARDAVDTWHVYESLRAECEHTGPNSCGVCSAYRRNHAAACERLAAALRGVHLQEALHDPAGEAE